MKNNDIIDGEEVLPVVESFRDIDSAINEQLLSWLNSSEALNPQIKNELLARLTGLRTKFQVIMVEAQKKIFRNFILDLETEEVTREYLRAQIPFMSNKERTDFLKTIEAINADKMSRLETQLTGFDFLNTTAMSLSTLSELKTSEDIVNEVKKLEPQRRAKLLIAANEIIKEINSLEPSESLDGSTEI